MRSSLAELTDLPAAAPGDVLWFRRENQTDVAGTCARVFAVVTGRRDHGWRFHRRGDFERNGYNCRDHHSRPDLYIDKVARTRIRLAENQTKYADALNSLTLVASPNVLDALYAFQQAVAYGAKIGDDAALNRHLDALLNVLRKDISPSRSIPSKDLSFRLMAAPPDTGTSPTTGS